VTWDWWSRADLTETVDGEVSGVTYMSRPAIHYAENRVARSDSPIEWVCEVLASMAAAETSEAEAGD